MTMVIVTIIICLQLFNLSMTAIQHGNTKPIWACKFSFPQQVMSVVFFWIIVWLLDCPIFN